MLLIYLGHAFRSIIIFSFYYNHLKQPTTEQLIVKSKKGVSETNCAVRVNLRNMEGYTLAN